MGDSLYACEPIFDICEKNKWKYIFRFKEGRIASVASEFWDLKSLEENDKKASIFWVNDISYNDRDVNLLEAMMETKNKQNKRFLFITDIKITKKNAERLVQAERSRWKIENEGFIHQKNRWHDIEHVNCHDYTAMKNHYLLVQIADILVQLYLNGAKILKGLKKSAKEKSSDLFRSDSNPQNNRRGFIPHRETDTNQVHLVVIVDHKEVMRRKTKLYLSTILKGIAIDSVRFVSKSREVN